MEKSFYEDNDVTSGNRWQNHRHDWFRIKYALKGNMQMPEVEEARKVTTTSASQRTLTRADPWEEP